MTSIQAAPVLLDKLDMALPSQTTVAKAPEFVAQVRSVLSIGDQSQTDVGKKTGFDASGQNFNFGASFDKPTPPSLAASAKSAAWRSGEVASPPVLQQRQAIATKAMAVFADPNASMASIQDAFQALKAISPNHQLTPDQMKACDHAAMRANEQRIATLPPASLPVAAKQVASPSFGKDHADPAGFRQSAKAAIEKRAMEVFANPDASLDDVRAAFEALKALNPDHKLTPDQQKACDAAALRANETYINGLPTADLPGSARIYADPTFGKDHADPAAYRQQALALVEKRAMTILSDPQASPQAIRDAVATLKVINPKHQLTPDQKAAYEKAAMGANERFIAKMPLKDLPHAAKECLAPTFGKTFADPAGFRQSAKAAIEKRAMEVFAKPDASLDDVRAAFDALKALNPGHKLTPDQQKACDAAAMRANETYINALPTADLPGSARIYADPTFGKDHADPAAYRQQALALVEKRAMTILSDPQASVQAIRDAVATLRAINPKHQLTPDQKAAYEKAAMGANERFIATMPLKSLPHAAKECLAPTFGKSFADPAGFRQSAKAAIEKRAMEVFAKPDASLDDVRAAFDALKALNPGHKLTPDQQKACDVAALRANETYINGLPTADLPGSARVYADPTFGKDHADPAAYRQQALALVEKRAMTILSDPKASVQAIRDAVATLKVINPKHQLTPDQKAAYEKAAMGANERFIAKMPVADLPHAARECKAATFGTKFADPAAFRHSAESAIEKRAQDVLANPDATENERLAAKKALAILHPAGT